MQALIYMKQLWNVELQAQKQDYSVAQWHTGHENMPLLEGSCIQHNKSSNSNQPLPLHTATGTASARDISCGDLLFGYDMKRVHDLDQFLWWWRVGTLKAVNRFPGKEEKRKKRKKKQRKSK